MAKSIQGNGRHREGRGKRRPSAGSLGIQRHAHSAQQQSSPVHQSAQRCCASEPAGCARAGVSRASPRPAQSSQSQPVPSSPASAGRAQSPVAPPSGARQHQSIKEARGRGAGKSRAKISIQGVSGPCHRYTAPSFRHPDAVGWDGSIHYAGRVRRSRVHVMRCKACMGSSGGMLGVSRRSMTGQFVWRPHASSDALGPPMSHLDVRRLRRA